MDVVVLYCEPWDTPLRTSKHHYVERLADAGWRVLYVEVPATPLGVLRRPGTFLGDGLPRLRAGVREVRDNVWAMTGLFPCPYNRGLGGVFDRLWLNALNQRAFLPRLRRAVAALGFSRPVVLGYLPLMLPILDDLAPSRVLFHMIDEWQGLPGIPASMAVLTQGMLRRADATVVTSRRLYERYRAAARDIHLLRHGTDTALFAPVARGEVAPDPALAAAGGVRIGYYGALHKLDFSLVSEVAGARPDWSFVFVGPSEGAQGLAAIPSLPGNVRLLPPRPRDELPGFLATCSVFWMPFQVNELTRSMSPIKVYEALSAGMAVVSSDLDETRAAAGELVAFASGADAHVAALETAMAEDGPARRGIRVRAMSRCDWAFRFEKFLALLDGSYEAGDAAAAGSG